MNRYVVALAAGCLAIVCGLFFSNCASLLGGGTTQDIQISSSPSSAHVKVERSVAMGRASVVWEGQTPATVNLKRKHQYLVTISMDGYQNAELALEQGTNGWVWGNIVCGGLIGLIIDFTNGAAKKLEPGEISMELVTALGPDNDESVYAVLHGLDENGDLRALPVPMIRNSAYTAVQ